MKRLPKGDKVDLVLYGLAWLLLCWGVFTRDWWGFALGAFFVLLYTIEDRR